MSKAETTKQVERSEKVKDKKAANSRSKMTGAQAIQVREALEQLNTTEPPQNQNGDCTVGAFMLANADLLVALQRKKHSLESIRAIFDAADIPITLKSLSSTLSRLATDEKMQSPEVSPQDREAVQAEEPDKSSQAPMGTMSDVVERPDTETSEDIRTESLPTVATEEALVLSAVPDATVSAAMAVTVGEVFEGMAANAVN